MVKALVDLERTCVDTDGGGILILELYFSMCVPEEFKIIVCKNVAQTTSAVRGLLSFRAIDVVVRIVTVEASFALHGSALHQLLVVGYDRCTCRVLRRDFVDAQGLLPEQSECQLLASPASTPSRFFLSSNILLLLTTTKYKSLFFSFFFC